MLPTKLILPAKLVAGTHVIDATTPETLVLDLSLPVQVLTGAPNGRVSRLPAAEGRVAAIAAGLPVPEPMTLGLTLFDLADGRRIFVCTELAENRGVSVTNAWPQLADRLLSVIGGVKPEQAVFVEHYFPGSYKSGHPEETFDLVEIEWREGRAVGQRWARI